MRLGNHIYLSIGVFFLKQSFYIPPAELVVYCAKATTEGRNFFTEFLPSVCFSAPFLRSFFLMHEITASLRAPGARKGLPRCITYRSGAPAFIYLILYLLCFLYTCVFTEALKHCCCFRSRCACARRELAAALTAYDTCAYCPRHRFCRVAAQR